MSITSFAFIVFIFAVLIIYYLVPKKLQWCVLLVSSLVFYLLTSAKGFVFVLLTAGSIYFATQLMENIRNKQKIYFDTNDVSKDEKKEIKEKNKKICKIILICTLVLNFGILCTTKYLHFFIDSINSLLALIRISTIDNQFSLIVPLGLSFYTFQSTGYLINVYWDNYKPERNPFKVLLFVSFFPQITQGPISEFDTLSAELFSEHKFDYKNYSWGFQRMIWGFMKKMVIADTLSPWVMDVFANYSQYSGISTLIGAFMYSIQIYADFSGYMDIMCGFCEMLGIRLTENFERPYFSKSIAEYWRRWHISLGAWFKNYIYYPIGISKWNRNLGKKLNKKFGKTIAKNVPATIALIIVWMTTGLWHGATWAYVVWGLVNGIFIIFSMWMEPVYEKTKTKLHIKESSFYWRAFATLRTFILVTFIKVLPEVGTISQGFGLWKRIFTNFTIPTSLSKLLPFMSGIWWQNAIVFVMIIALFVVSLLQRKHKIRELFGKLPIFFRMMILVGLFFIIVVIGIPAAKEGVFLYEAF